MIRRRDFITLLGGAAAWPVGARAQQPSKLPTIGILGTSTPTAWSLWVPAFTQRIRELGWIEGRQSRSNIDGQKTVPSVRSRSPPSSSG